VNEKSIDLESVKREIQVEVDRQRENGEFDAIKEQELERAFLLFAPRQGRGGALATTLRGVDAATFIDPVAPIESNQPAGRVVKQTLRKTSFWYFNWITEQVTRALSTIAVALHLVEEEIDDLNQRMGLVTIEATPILDGAAPAANAWWADKALSAFEGVNGRVLVAACGDGGLVRRLIDAGLDGYGIDARPNQFDSAQLQGLDLRRDDLLEHLAHVASRRLVGAVLTGTTEGIFVTQRPRLLDLIDAAVDARGVVVIHALHPDALAGDKMPPALDFVGAAPMRPATWSDVLASRGYDVEIETGPDGSDFLVVARRPGFSARS
jgi:Methionine biosynthesis protein MetW